MCRGVCCFRRRLFVYISVFRTMLVVFLWAEYIQLVRCGGQRRRRRRDTALGVWGQPTSLCCGTTTSSSSFTTGVGQLWCDFLVFISSSIIIIVITVRVVVSQSKISCVVTRAGPEGRGPRPAALPWARTYVWRPNFTGAAPGRAGRSARSAPDTLLLVAWRQVCHSRLRADCHV